MKQFLISLSGVFEAEGFLPQGASIFDFRELEGTCCYCSEEALKALSEAIPTAEGLCWCDTGDYHYLSLLRARKLAGPFELILLDNHSDDFDVCGLLSCGNWVTELKKECSCTCTLLRNFTDYKEKPDGLPVFLSLDLDVLREDDFITNWDQGVMSLGELEAILRSVFSTRRVLGADVCGGITVSKGANENSLESNRLTREYLSHLFETLTKQSEH